MDVPSAPNNTHIQGLSARAKTFRSSIGAASVPVMGVHTPTSKRIATIAVSITITADCSECPVGEVTIT